MSGLGLTREEVTWLKAAVECHGTLAAQAAIARMLRALIELSPLTEQKIQAWRDNLSKEMTADRDSALNREAAARAQLDAAGRRPGLDVLEEVFRRAADGEVI